MHPEAYEGFGWAMRQVGLCKGAGDLRVLDVGGQNVNGSVHDYFARGCITTLDLENADIIADARVWLPDRKFDVVIATEVFEHVRDWRRVVHTMRSALDPNGPGFFLATCASTHRPPHGATGGPRPVKGEWYENVSVGDLTRCLETFFCFSDVEYQYPPGDAYMWAIA